MIQCPICGGDGCDTLEGNKIKVSGLHDKMENLATINKKQIDNELICDNGYMKIFKSLNSYCDEEIGFLHQMTLLIDKGILPDSGGLSDQNYKAISAINYWTGIERQKKAEKESK